MFFLSTFVLRIGHQSLTIEMSKFKVLKNNQAYMAWLGIYSHDLLEPTNEFFKSFSSYYILIFMLIALWGSAVFIQENWSVQVKPTLGAIKISFTAAQVFSSFSSVGINMNKIKALHLGLQQIVDDGMYCIYLRLN